MINKLKWQINAFLEYRKFKKQYTDAESLLHSSSLPSSLPVCFIAGCGRSGTTLLGRLLSFHEQVCYFNEPRAKWANVNPHTDIWGYWVDPEPDTDLILHHATSEELIRFKKVFFADQHIVDEKFLVEKSPENAFRLPWLHELQSDARFIHMLRNGVDVIRSILVDASFDIPYGLRNMNNWYGKKNIKKKLLMNTAKKMNIHADVINCCSTEVDLAAMEWICSVTYIQSVWPCIPDGYRITVRYEKLLEETVNTFAAVLDFLRLDFDEILQQKIINYVKQNKRTREIFKLSSPLNKLFNDMLAHYEYPTV